MGLERFTLAQEEMYPQALAEIKNGKKNSHWMWYIFPQLKGLGSSPVAKHYGLSGIEEAGMYLRHPVLGPRLIEISNTLLSLHGFDAYAIFEHPDDLKLHSSMTLFSRVDGAGNIFKKVLDKYFQGKPDRKTLEILENPELNDDLYK
ncbi:MAG: DUF1810 domain-containing protein [Bacteroidia bacterium]